MIYHGCQALGDLPKIPRMRRPHPRNALDHRLKLIRLRHVKPSFVKRLHAVCRPKNLL